MNEIETKKKRIERLRSLDDSKLSGLVVELSTLEAKNQKETAQMTSLQQQLQETCLPDSTPSIESLLLWKQWTDQLRNQIHEIQKRIHDNEVEIEKILKEIRQQKATVNTWDQYIESLDTQIGDEMQRSETIEAIDRALQHRKTEL